MRGHFRLDTSRGLRVAGCVCLLAGAAATLTPGCSFIPTAAQQEFKKAEAALAEFISRSVTIAETVAELKQQLEPLGEKIVAVARKLRDRALPAIEGMALYNELLAKKAEILAKLAKLKAEGTAVADAAVRTKEHLTALRKQYGIPWWKIAAEIALGALGVGGLAGIPLVRRLRKVAKDLTATERQRDEAHDGLRVIVGAVETGKANGEIKSQVAKAGNATVEAIVSEMNASKAKSTTESA